MEQCHVSREDYLDALEKIIRDGSDGFSKMSTGVLTALGLGAGAAVAAPLAGACGVSTLLGSQLLGSALGGVFVAATPVGWLVGASALGGALMYGLSRIARRGGREDQKRTMLRRDIRQKILQRTGGSLESEDASLRRVAEILKLAALQDRIDSAKGMQILSDLKTGRITADDALRDIQSRLA